MVPLDCLYLSLFALFLGVFFYAAVCFHSPFYILFILALAILMGYLVFSQVQINKDQTESALAKEDILERSNLLEAEKKKEIQVIEAFQSKIVSYFQLKGLTEELSMSLSLEDTSKTILAEVHKFFGNKETTAILYLFQPSTGALSICLSQKGGATVNLKSKKGDAFDEWIVKTMQRLWVEDSKKEFRFDSEKIITEDDRTVRSLMGVPLLVSSNALGILRIDSPQENQFNSDDLRLFSTMADIASVAVENAQLYERLEELAITDSLTGLYLRRYLLDRLPTEIDRHLLKKEELSFLMIDLDHFKKYNDEFGHMAGDIVLRSVGKFLSDFFNEPGSFVARYGGEEFAVLLSSCPKEKAVELAKDVCQKIREQPITLRRAKTFVSVSIGVASFPRDAQIKEDLIIKADEALYASKRTGRNRVCAA